MPDVVRVTPDAVWTDPDIEGLEVSDTEWRLDFDRYQEFLVETTGMCPAESLSASDCYRMGNRLQALIEERKRQDKWGPALVEAYPDVDSLKAFVWVARFLRACHDADEILR